MKKLHIPINQWKTLDPNLLPGIGNRLKIDITPILYGATHILNLTDLSNYYMLEDSKYDFVKPYTKETLISITDKVEIGNLPLSTLQTLIPYCSEDVLEFSKGPVFLKRRRTLIKERSNALNYSSWDTTVLLDNTAGPELYKQQESPHPVCGEFVLQNKISYPIKETLISISVNEYSDVLVWEIVTATLTAANNFSEVTSDTHNKAKYQNIIDKIQSICTTYHIKNSIHCIEFIEQDGGLVLMDWNLRFSIPSVLYNAKIYPILDKPIAHMMGIAAPNNCIYHHQTKIFCIPGGKSNTKILPGLHIRDNFIGNNINEVRVQGIAESDSDLSDLFNNFMEINNII